VNKFYGQFGIEVKIPLIKKVWPKIKKIALKLGMQHRSGWGKKKHR